ncbi:MAG: helicase-associated domain-containing protein, partial [Candidatus Schekmanbacteria bacterium]|nr:helicase-associated domain-containing protein [Candidatus Schekmanbacteria bacterium]
MHFRAENPLYVQGDHTLLLEVDNPRYEAARDRLARFAELIKSPEHVHTYRLTPLSIWNACAAGMCVGEIADTLKDYSKYDIPAHIEVELRDYASRYGQLKIIRWEAALYLEADELPLAEEVWQSKNVRRYLEDRLGSKTFLVLPQHRGRLKQALVKTGFPAEDLAGYVVGESLDLQLRETSRSGLPFGLRTYQEEAVSVFHAGGAASGGSGVIVLPCGAGKTIVGIGAMVKLGVCTLILTTSTTAVRQWIAEVLDKTHLPAEHIGEYTGYQKDIRPVTVTTYQILTYRKRKDEEFKHFSLFDG